MGVISVLLPVEAVVDQRGQTTVDVAEGGGRRHQQKHAGVQEQRSGAVSRLQGNQHSLQELAKQTTHQPD
jgi:hypothetical protein